MCIGAVFILQVHNLFLFPASHGFDASGHIEYIHFLKVNSRIPLPFEGWELWQPPLYYVIASLMPSLFYMKVIGLCMWALLGFVSFRFFTKQYSDTNWGLLGSLVSISLPVVLSSTFPISNEFFSTFFISLSLLYYFSHYKLNTIKTSIFLGVLLSISLLAKATAFVLVAAIFLDCLIQCRGKILLLIKKLLIPGFIALLVSGWFYIRNIVLYRNPFIASFDFPEKNPLTQPIIERSLSFFTTLKGFVTIDLFNSHYYSFLSGTYFSWFYDGHNVLIPVQQFSKIGAVLVVLSVTLLIFFFIGLIKELRHKKQQSRVFEIYSLLLFVSYVLYNFRLPYYSTVKGIFIMSSLIPFVYFFLTGIYFYKKYILYITFYFLLYTAVIIKNFWILSSWYSGGK